MARIAKVLRRDGTCGGWGGQRKLLSLLVSSPPYVSHRSFTKDLIGTPAGERLRMLSRYTADEMSEVAGELRALCYHDPDLNITGFKNTSYPEIGFGLQYLRGKHAFTLTFSNTQTTTTSRYNSSNLVLKPKDLVIGFNLFRRW